MDADDISPRSAKDYGQLARELLEEARTCAAAQRRRGGSSLNVHGGLNGVIVLNAESGSVSQSLTVR